MSRHHVEGEQSTGTEGVTVVSLEFVLEVARRRDVSGCVSSDVGNDLFV